MDLRSEKKTKYWKEYNQNVERLIYKHIDDYSSKVRLANRLKISRKTLYKHLYSLQEKGLLDDNFNKIKSAEAKAYAKEPINIKLIQPYIKGELIYE